jgi:5-enolpyruvylshikimate-3-phosphate synthase
MAFGVLGAATGGEIEIDDPDCVAVSYPRFWDDLHRAVVREG